MFSTYHAVLELEEHEPDISPVSAVAPTIENGTPPVLGRSNVMALQTLSLPGVGVKTLP